MLLHRVRFENRKVRPRDTQFWLGFGKKGKIKWDGGTWGMVRLS